MIAVTCRNGEHFSIDPDAIERIETDPDTVVILLDGSKYVVDQSFDEMLRVVRDHRATALVARERLVNGFAATPAALRHRRHRSRDHGTRDHGSRDGVPIVILPGRDED